MDVQRVIELIQSKLDREINLFNAEFEAILKKIAKEVELRSMNYNTAITSLNFDYEFNQILKDTGYYDLINRFIDTSYDKTYLEIVELFASTGLTVAYTAEDLAIFQSLKNLDLEFFQHVGNNAASLMKRDLYKYSMSDMTSSQIAESIKQSLQDTELAKYSNTYAETLISNYNQAVIDTKSQGVDGEVYIYRGVKDSKTRTFCECLINQHKSYNKADAMSIKDDKRRQYNCRHLIVPVSKEYAEASGYALGKFTC